MKLARRLSVAMSVLVLWAGVASAVPVDFSLDTVTIVGGDSEGLWRDKTAVAARFGEIMIVVEEVRVVHRLHPTAEIIVVQGLLHARRVDWFAHKVFESGTVQGLVSHVKLQLNNSSVDIPIRAQRQNAALRIG